jgi:hypothetical protein
VALSVGGNRLPLREAFDQLDFVLFAARFEELDRLPFGKFTPGDRQLAGCDVAGALFDILEIIRRKRPVVGEVVVEAVFQRRSDRQLGRWEQFFDGLGHDMGAAVAVDLAAFRAVESKRLDGRLLRQRVREVHYGSVDSCRKDIRAKGHSQSRQGASHRLAGLSSSAGTVFGRNVYRRHELRRV